MEPDNPEAFTQAIVWLFHHPEEAKKMAEKGIQRVYHLFSAERMSEKTLRVYEQLLKRGR